jgi:hypothetical protein
LEKVMACWTHGRAPGSKKNPQRDPQERASKLAGYTKATQRASKRPTPSSLRRSVASSLSPNPYSLSPKSYRIFLAPLDSIWYSLVHQPPEPVDNNTNERDDPLQAGL